MPKPTNTALDLNDNFSDSEFNPQFGDVASQGQVTRKSIVTSARATGPARPGPVAVNANQSAMDESQVSEIYVSIDPQGGITYTDKNGNKLSNVTMNATNPTVWLKFTGDHKIYVCTLFCTGKDQDWEPSSIFENQLDVYCDVPTDDYKNYTLKITGQITFVPLLGSNGTINVGSAPDQDCADDDDGAPLH